MPCKPSRASRRGGCPPIAEELTAVISYVLTFESFPELDRQGRPKMFYSQHIHGKRHRRPDVDDGRFVEAFDDEGARTPMEQIDEGAEYCLVRAPRWRGKAMGVGPLAHYIVGYAKARAEIMEQVDPTLKTLRLC